MADDLIRIRDYFIDHAKNLGVRIKEKPPAKGYRYTADIFDGDTRIGRLYMRKTTVSWKAAGAQSVVRLSGSENVAELLGLSDKKLESKETKKEEATGSGDGGTREPEVSETPESESGKKKSEPKEAVEKPEKDNKKSTPDLKEAKKSKGPKKKEEKALETELEAVDAKDKEKKGKEKEDQKKSEIAEKPAGEEDSEEEAVTPGEVQEPAKPVSSLSRAVSEFKSGNFEKALQWARLSLAENPESAAAKDILRRSERLLAEKKHGSDIKPKPGMDRPPTEKAVSTERTEVLKKSPVDKEPSAPKSTEYPQKTEPSVKKPESPVTEPPKKTSVPTQPATPPAPPKKAERGARIPLWAVVAFIGLVTAVVYLWPGNRPSGEDKREQDRKTALPEVTVDPVETLQTYIGVLEEQISSDSSGVSTAKLMNALIELNSLSGPDNMVLERIHELAYRADSLAVISSRSNHLDNADSFLDESRNGWVTLLRLAENDSFFNERLEWNREYRSVVTARRRILESMILISEGSFTRGSNRGAFDSRPASEIELSAFYISMYEITNNQYRAFIFDTGRAGPAARNQYEKPYGWTDSQFPEGKGDYPVVLVKWEDANAFAEWLGGSLPSEVQWEKAARGSDGRHYPWGNGFYGDSLVCRESRSEYSPVGFKSGDLSPVGVHDMAGSVREWTNDWYGSDYYLTRSSRQKDAAGPRSGRFRVVRGASWRTEGAVSGLTHARDNASPWTIHRDLGFRVSFAESTFRSLPVFTSLRKDRP